MISLIINGVKLKGEFNWSANELDGFSAPPIQHQTIDFLGLNGSRNLNRSRYEERNFSITGKLYKSPFKTVDQMKDEIVKLVSLGLHEDLEIQMPHVEILNGQEIVKYRTIYARLSESPVIVRTYKPVHKPVVLDMQLNFIANDPFFYYKDEYKNEIYLSGDLFLKSPLKEYYPRDPDYVYVGLTLANLLGDEGNSLTSDYSISGLDDSHIYFETCNNEKFSPSGGNYTVVNNTGGTYNLAIYDLTEMGELHDLFKESHGKNFWYDLENKYLEEYLPYVSGVQGLDTSTYGVIEL